MSVLDFQASTDFTEAISKVTPYAAVAIEVGERIPGNAIAWEA